MFIIVIHWRIKDSDEAEAAFLKYWQTEVTIGEADTANLIGEFLCRPAMIDSRRYPTIALDSGNADPCRSFANVAMWKDEASFYAAVGPKMSAKKDFELVSRERIPFNPLLWRRGTSELPS